MLAAAVKQDGCALRYASDELKGDRGVVMAAAKNQRLAECLLCHAVIQDEYALKYASDACRDGVHETVYWQEIRTAVRAARETH